MNTNKAFVVAIWSLALALFLFCAYRANVLSFTHDEAGSYLFFKESNLMDFFFDKNLWKSANNHLLNTFLYQQTIALLGDTSFHLRLPNVLAFGLFLSSGIILLFKLLEDKWVLSLSLLLLLANPYVFDFFSLSRGYGLMLAFEMLGFYMFYKYLDTAKNRYLIIAYLALVFMTSAILSSIILIPALSLALWLYLYRRKSLNTAAIIIPISMGIGALIIFFTPITALSALDEFKYGTRSILNVFHYLIEDSLMGRQYFGYYTHYMFSLAIILLFTYGAYLAIRNTSVESKVVRNSFMKFTAYGFVFTLLGLLATYVLFDTRFPQHRQSLFMYPFMVLLVSKVFNAYKEHHYLKWGIKIIALFTLVHFFVANRTERTREWWYDYDTKNILTQIVNANPEKRVKLNVDWHFHPSSSYYSTKEIFKNIELAAYSKHIDAETDYDYYICFKEEIPLLEHKYELEYSNTYKVYLLKKKI